MGELSAQFFIAIDRERRVPTLSTKKASSQNVSEVEEIYYDEMGTLTST